LYLLLIRFQRLHENRHDMQIVNVRVQRSPFSIFTEVSLDALGGVKSVEHLRFERDHMVGTFFRTQIEIR